MVASRNRGFTLVELMITIAIVAILASAGLPAFSNFLRDQRMHGSATRLLNDVTTARTEAARTHRTVSLCPSTAGAACDSADWSAGRLLFVDANGNGAAEAGEILRFTAAGGREPAATPTGITDRIAFESTGVASATGSVRLCDDRSGPHGRSVEWNAAGRVALRAANCP